MLWRFLLLAGLQAAAAWVPSSSVAGRLAAGPNAMPRQMSIRSSGPLGPALRPHALQPCRRPARALGLSMGAVEDIANPESLEWLPPAQLSKDTEGSGGDVMTIPLFPLGGYVYLPHSEHTLSIFEPRYRALYNDILFSGSRRFAVCTVDPKTGSFSRYAAVLYLKELKEVSEKTNDAVKFVCDHEVIGRVRIDKILNPSSWMKADTYLKVEAKDVEDEEPDEAANRETEIKLEEEFCRLVDLQHELSEAVKFTKGSVSNFKTGPGEDLWATIRMWQNFQEQKLLSIQVTLQQDFQAKLIAYLTKSMGESKIPDVINISDLPPNLQAEVKNLQTRMAGDMAPIQEEYQRGMQLMMQSESHARRLDLLRGLIKTELGLLDVKKQIKSMFGGEGEDKVRKDEEGM